MGFVTLDKVVPTYKTTPPPPFTTFSFQENVYTEGAQLHVGL